VLGFGFLSVFQFRAGFLWDPCNPACQRLLFFTLSKNPRVTSGVKAYVKRAICYLGLLNMKYLAPANNQIEISKCGGTSEGWTEKNTLYDHRIAKATGQLTTVMGDENSNASNRRHFNVSYLPSNLHPVMKELGVEVEISGLLCVDCG